MKVKKTKVGLFISEEAHNQLKEMAKGRRLSNSRLIERWIGISYIKYNKRKEESQDAKSPKGSNLDN